MNDNHEVVVKVNGEPMITVTSFGTDDNMRKLADADPADVTVEVWRVREDKTRLVRQTGDVATDLAARRKLIDSPQA